MATNPTDRPYNKNSPADRAWASQVHERAKPIVLQEIGAATKPVRFAELLRAMKQAYPQLCDDSIRNPRYLKQPEWEHRVANAIQVLKNARDPRIRLSGDGWELANVRPTPTPVTPVPPPSPPPNHLRQRLRERLLQTSPAEFERVVGKFLGALGLSEIHVTGRTADGGIDGNGIVPVFNLKVCFQAKRWAMGNNVGSSPVRELVGSVTTRRYDKGVFITTSAFTAGAREEAEGTESKVVLIDGDRLVDMMIEKGLGIREVTVVTQQELDEEFFQEL